MQGQKPGQKKFKHMFVFREGTGEVWLLVSFGCRRCEDNAVNNSRRWLHYGAIRHGLLPARLPGGMRNYSVSDPKRIIVDSGRKKQEGYRKKKTNIGVKCK